MQAFRCVVADRNGKKREEVKHASSKEEAMRSFATGDLFLLSIEPVKEASISRRGAYPEKVVSEFTEMTAMLLSSGLGFSEAIDVESGIAEKGKLPALLSEIKSGIDKGESFSSVLERRSNSFPALYTGMVRIGERIGSLDTVLPRLSSWLKDRKSFKEKMLGALAYPALILVMSLVGTALIAFLLLPRLVELFSELGGPGAAALEKRIRIASTMFRGFSVLSALVIPASIVLAALRRGSGPVAIAIDGMLLRIPFAGKLAMSWETLNFAFAMETLAKGGVAMEAAIKEAALTVGNKAYRRALEAIRESVIRGEPLSRAVAKRRELPPYISRWIAAGEKSGQTHAVFEQIRRYFQGEIDRATSRSIAIVEPALIIFIGIVLLFFVVLFVLPLFSLYGSML